MATSIVPSEGRCVFLTEEGLCSLHETGMKPAEARLIACETYDEDLHELVASTWKDSEEGLKLIETWREEEMD